jgi:peroxiredoxin Q/BCP
MVNLKVGDPAPPINATDQDGRRITLEEYRGKKIVLYFYPKDNTPGCTAEACDLRDHYSQFVQQDFEVIGVSADSESSHKKFIKKHDLPFRLISDGGKKVLQDYGAWGEKKLYGRPYTGILRKTFIIDENGIIIRIIEKVNTGGHSQQIFAELSH